MDEKTITVRWAIKGYRVYKIKPHENIPMTVEHEPDDSHEPNAMVVKMPDATTIDSKYLNDITRESSDGNQTVAEIAGKIVGHVPANLCRAFKKCIDLGLTKCIKCCYNGRVYRRVNVPYNQSFQRRSPGKDRQGGGVEIGCNYVITVKQEVFNQVLRILCTCLKEEDYERVTFQTDLGNWFFGNFERQFNHDDW